MIKVLQATAYGILTAAIIYGFSEMLARGFLDKKLDLEELGLLFIVLIVFILVQTLNPHICQGERIEE